MLIHHATSKPAQSISTTVSAALAAISEADLRAWVKRLSVPRHFRQQPEENRDAAIWIAAQLQSWGYSVQLQGQFYNVVALPRDLGRPLLLVGAHFDSTPVTPGADDNASAVAAMLGCAKSMSNEFPDASVGFVAFNCEEDGLLGSQDFVENFVLPEKLVIAGAHVLEMVGYASHEPGTQMTPTSLPIRIPNTGDFLGLLGNSKSVALLDNTLALANTYLPGFPVISLRVTLGLEKHFPVLQRSDHAPFWQHGIPSVMWTDTSEFRNPHYHQMSDLPETLDYPFLRRVTQLLFACTASFGTEPVHK